jgi:preprotein translocase subunit SecA
MSTYKLGVVPIPTNRPMVRKDQADLVYATEVDKFDQVVEDIVERHQEGQPVLVGTTSVEKSEYLSKLLAKRGVKHEVLNAKNHAREASIVAQAGRLGAVTVATNMAGRGTDIMLGGNAEHMAVSAMTEKGLSPSETPDEYEAEWDAVFDRVKAEVEAEAEKVREVGGLYVLGTERHESRRIDNQLRGRSGRQGDPGESRFYLSLQDDLMRLFNAGAAEMLMARAPKGTAIESKTVSRAIRSAQSQVEGRNAEIRKNVLKYDDVLNRQREAIYSDRRHILEGDDLHERVQGFVTSVIDQVVDEYTIGNSPDDWDLDMVWSELTPIYPVSITVAEVRDELGGKLAAKSLKAELASDAKLAYQRREEQLGSPAMRELERRVVLSVIDRRWRDHLYEMDYLKDGIGLRAMAQRDPLIEYQREGFAMFQTMMGQIREETVGFLFNLDVEVTNQGGTAAIAAKGLGAGGSVQGISYSAPGEDGGDIEVRSATGQLQQAATARARQVQALQRAVAAQVAQDQQPAQQSPAVTGGASRGAFGQQVGGDGQAAAPMNRAQRRAQERKK